MCGRYVLHAPPDEVARAFGLDEVPTFEPRYNIAPTQAIVVVRHRAVPEGSNAPPREALNARWGLVPGWVKDPKDFPLLINARSEAATTKASFRGAMRTGRVLVPISGFYEWQRLGEGRGAPRQAFFVRPRAGGMVAVAGLMEGGDAPSAAILTVDACGRFREIHDRMPVSVAPEDWSRWLDPANAPAEVADVPRTPDDEFWEAVPVSDRVNKVREQGPGLIEPVEPVRRPPPKREDAKVDEPEQGSLF